MRSPLRAIGLLSLVALVAACAPAAEQPAAVIDAPRSDQERAEIEERLFQLENEWMDVHFSGDTSALDRILADDLVYTLHTGEVVGKERYIELSANDPLTWESMDVTDMSAHWYGDDVVLVIGGSTNKVRDAEGNEVHSSGRFTNVFVERDGQWQCVIGHLTVIEE